MAPKQNNKPVNPIPIHQICAPSTLPGYQSGEDGLECMAWPWVAPHAARSSGARWVPAPDSPQFFKTTRSLNLIVRWDAKFCESAHPPLKSLQKLDLLNLSKPHVNPMINQQARSTKNLTRMSVGLFALLMPLKRASSMTTAPLNEPNKNPVKSFTGHCLGAACLDANKLKRCQLGRNLPPSFCAFSAPGPELGKV